MAWSHKARKGVVTVDVTTEERLNHRRVEEQSMSKQRKRQRQRAVNAWTANDVRAVVCNPVYAGLGPFPPLIDDEQWIQAVTRLLRYDGEEPTLLQIRTVLQQTFGALPDALNQPGWLATAKRAIAQQGADPYLRQLLCELRAAYHDVTVASLMQTPNR